MKKMKEMSEMGQRRKKKKGRNRKPLLFSEKRGANHDEADLIRRPG